jgi:ligand-binding sensor domain-containing protein/signal transduction histidine kinase
MIGRSQRPWQCKSITAVLTVVFFACPAHAIDPNRAISQYIRERWGSEKGFPDGSVSAFAQTTDGYLWIGTEKGLVRFDGLNFRLFEQAIPTSLPIGPVRGLLADAEGNLWILLQSTRILRYHDGRFEPGSEEELFGVTSVLRRKDGTVLLSSVALGTVTYRVGKFGNLTSPVQLANSEPPTTDEAADNLSTRLNWAAGVAIHRFAAPHSPVVSMAETTDGKVWLGTRDRGLFYVDQGLISAVGKGLLTPEINCLLALDNRELWIGTDIGVMRWDGTRLTQAGLPPAISHAHVLAMTRDRDANIWLGTSAGLLRFNSNGVSSEERKQRPSLQVTALFEDREGNLWMGSGRGIERLRDSAFVTYSVADGLPSDQNGPVYVDAKGRTWFAPLEGGLHWTKAGGTGSVRNAVLAGDVVYSISGREGELWLGRQRGGLTVLRNHGASITSKTYTRADGLAQNTVYAVYESNDGTVWAGTLNGGVSEFRNARFTTYTTANGLSSNAVNSIAESPDGAMWFATPNGLNVLSKGKWRAFTVRDGLPSADLNCLFVDSAGVLWIGSSSGLAFLVSDRIEVRRDAPEALREQIFGVAEDRSGWLWIATSHHVLRINRKVLLEGIFSDSALRQYGLADGLQAVEGVKRDQSVFADSLGRVWFAMNRGLSVVDPSRLTRSSVPALVHVDAVAADGIPVSTQGPIRIESARQRITFSYTGLSLSDPERVRYRYRLDGFDRDWSEPVTARTAVYTNLSPGSYTFRVTACNSDGLWNDEGVILDFSVTPAWFQTGWCRVLYVFSVVSIAWTVYRLRVIQIAKSISTLCDERLAERTRMARELHDTFLQTVQGSKLVADDALELSADPIRMRRAMEQLSLWLGTATQEGQAALNSLRTATTQTNDLAEALRRATEECRMHSPVEVSFAVVGNAKPVHPVVRDEVYRIGYEAIRNACIHSGARRLEIELTYARDLTLRVSDNGTGIDPAAARGKDGHFGLRGMRERAARIGGKLTLRSSTSTGTEISLIVPGGIIFRKTMPVRRSMFARMCTRIRMLFRSRDQTSNAD